MSVFRNTTNQWKYLPDYNGAETLFKPLGEPGDTHTCSNYYKRYVDLGWLTLVQDDGGTWDDETNQPAAVLRQHALSVAAQTTYGDNTVDLSALIGGPAKHVTIETDEDVRCRINGDALSTCLIAADTSRVFDPADGLRIGTIAFDRTISGATTAASVVITATGVPSV